MNEIGLYVFQIGEILPAVEVFLLCFSIGLSAIFLKVAWRKCRK